MRSLLVLPNTIAPKRPLPTGNASTHSLAGWSYQSTRGRRLEISLSTNRTWLISLAGSEGIEGIATAATAVCVRNLRRLIFSLIFFKPERWNDNQAGRGRVSAL